MSLGIEVLVVKKIENGIRGIKLGTKKPEDLNIYSSLNKLKSLNVGLYEELTTKYENIRAIYNKKTNNY